MIHCRCCTASYILFRWVFVWYSSTEVCVMCHFFSSVLIADPDLWPLLCTVYVLHSSPLSIYCQQRIMVANSCHPLNFSWLSYLVHKCGKDTISVNVIVSKAFSRLMKTRWIELIRATWCSIIGWRVKILSIEELPARKSLTPALLSLDIPVQYYFLNIELNRSPHYSYQ